MRVYVETKGKVLPEGLIDLKALIRTFGVSSAECERAFNQRNLISTDVRNKLAVNNIACFLFITINGPPLHLFNAQAYAKVWLTNHHSADYTKGKKRAATDDTDDVHKMFHKWL